MFQATDEDRLFQVRVFNGNGKLKKIIPVKKLKKRHWEVFELERQRNSDGKNYVILGRSNSNHPDMYTPEHSNNSDLVGIYEGG